MHLQDQPIEKVNLLKSHILTIKFFTEAMFCPELRNKPVLQKGLDNRFHLIHPIYPIHPPSEII